MAQIATIVSEALQAKIRTLLPSQQGFTEDLQAQNVIVPIVDLTETASGSLLREDLQRAWDFATSYDQCFIGTTTLINTTGFWKVQMQAFLANNSSTARLKINDGTSDKEIFSIASPASLSTQISELTNEFTVFLRAGDSLTCTVSGSSSRAELWYRQIADINGNLVSPSGFTSE